MTGFILSREPIILCSLEHSVHRMTRVESRQSSERGHLRPGGVRGRAVFAAGWKTQRLRGGLVFKAHGLFYHSTLGLIVIKKKDAHHHSSISSGGAIECEWLPNSAPFRSFTCTDRHSSQFKNNYFAEM